MLRHEKKRSKFPTRADTNQPAQQKNIVRGLKFWIYELSRGIVLCSENKGTDQLRCFIMTSLNYIVGTRENLDSIR